MKHVHFLATAAIGTLAICGGGTFAAAIVPTVINTSSGWDITDARMGSDGNEATHAVAPTGGWAVYDLGAKTSFNEVSITSRDWIDGNPSRTPNNFQIQIPDDGTPNSATWSPVGTASDIFGYATPGTTNYDAGRRLILTSAAVSRYFRYVNMDSNSDAFSEIQVSRPILITDSGTSSSNSRTNPLNYAADGDPNSFYSSSTSSAGSLTFNALTAPGELVKAITIQHQPAASNYFPTGQVQVYTSSTDDPSNFDTLSADTTLNSSSTGGYTYTIDLNQPVDTHYFKFVWSDTLNHFQSQIAEMGVVTIVPEPAALGLLTAGGLLLIRRRRKL